MKLEYVGNRGAIALSGAKVLGGTFRNFQGGPDKFNTVGGRRYFHVALTEDIANELNDKNWRVKILAPREEGDETLYILKVNVNFSGYRPPKIHTVTNGKSVKCDEQMTGELDYSDILEADLVLNPFEWDGKIGAYLEEGHFIIREEYFASKYSAEEEEEPF